MEVFDLIVDEKVTVWRRSRIEVEANTLEEAVELCSEYGSLTGTCLESEFLYETEELINPSKENPCTLEVMNTSYEVLYSDNLNKV